MDSESQDRGNALRTYQPPPHRSDGLLLTRDIAEQLRAGRWGATVDSFTY